MSKYKQPRPERSEPREASARVREPQFVTGSPADIVLGVAPPAWGRVLVSSGIATLALYVAAAVAVSRAGPSIPRHAVPVAPVALQLTEHVVELPAPPEPVIAPPAAVEAAPTQAIERTPVTRAAPAAARSAAPPPPARAAEVVAKAPSADAPVDFAGFDIATGDAERHAGGVTAASGTNGEAVHAQQIDRSAAPGHDQGARSLAQPVRLPARDWTCPWPQQADVLSVDEERVVLRVQVEVDGRVSLASVSSDPGHGFGEAALRCARRHRFLPALDASGRPTRATSPPIHVTFTR